MLCSYAQVAPSPPEIRVSEPVDDSDKAPGVPEQQENLLQIPKWDFVLKKEREAVRMAEEKKRAEESSSGCSIL